MDSYSLVFRIHALRRMFQRDISVSAVRHVLQTGTTIEEYPNDVPYPSRLVLGWFGARPVHIVVAQDESVREAIIITVYEPDPAQWDAGFTRRIA